MGAWLVKKIIRVRIETHSVWMVYWRGSPLRAWCERCGSKVDIFQGQEAEALVAVAPHNVSGPRRYLWSLRMCLRSLRQLVGKTKENGHETNQIRKDR